MKRFLSVLVLCTAVVASAQIPLRQNTAADVTLGPFVDATDGVTRETALTVTGWTCSLIKGVTYSAIDVTAELGPNDAVHLGQGFYSLTLAPYDVNVVGSLIIDVNDPNAMPVTARFVVYRQDTYDMMFSEGPGDSNDLVDIIKYALDDQGYTAVRAVKIDSILEDMGTTVPAQLANLLLSLQTEVDSLLSAIAAIEVTGGGTTTSNDGWIKR